MFIIDSYLKIVFFAASLAVFAVLSRKKSEYGVCLAAFFLPLYIFKFNLWGLPLNFFEVLVYFLFLIWLSRGGFEKMIKLFSEIKENRTFTAGLTLFFAGVLISTFLSDDLRTSAGILKGWFIAPFLYFLIIKAEIKTENQIKNIFAALAASGSDLLGFVGRPSRGRSRTRRRDPAPHAPALYGRGEVRPRAGAVPPG